MRRIVFFVLAITVLGFGGIGPAVAKPALCAKFAELEKLKATNAGDEGNFKRNGEHLKKQADFIKKLIGSAPSTIKSDLKALADAEQQEGSAMTKLGDGKKLDPVKFQKALAEIQKITSSKSFIAATGHIGAWQQQQCSPNAELNS